jgi:sulfite exporter TauE/SafE/copper chaperone CopZ
MEEIFHIKGMHCKSCELLLEEKIGGVSGVQRVHASNQKNIVKVFSSAEIDKSTIIRVINDAGYSLSSEDLPVMSKDNKDYFNFTLALVIFLVLVLIAKMTNLSEVMNLNIGAGSSLFVVFLIGLTAGVSTCMALVGGLVLGAAAKYNESHQEATVIQKFRPHLFFNIGRITSYFILGGVIGYLGSFFRLSGTFSGFMAIIVGLVMFVLGIQLLGLFPRFSASITLPEGLARILRLDDKKDKEYSHKNAFVLGTLTFFLPCGFTQAMQVFAIQSGNFVTGALVMGVFALGTAPGLLGIGGITSIIRKGSFANVFFKFIGVVLIAFAVFNLSNGYNLSGLKQYMASANKSDARQAVSITTVSGVQVVKATYESGKNILPKKITVKAGQPVRVEIFAKTDGVGCMGSVMVPGLVKTPQFYEKGKTATLEFTAKDTGSYDITCAMGLKSGEIDVVN